MVDFMSSEASATPMTDAMVVFFVSAMSVLPSGTMAARTACGKTMVLNVWVKDSPRRAGGLRLAEVHGVDTGAQGLGDEGGGVEDKAHHGQTYVVVDEECRRLAARERDAEGLVQAEGTEQHDQRERRIAHDRDYTSLGSAECRRGDAHRGQDGA